MLKRDVEYVDFNGFRQSETLYFNLNEAELIRLDVQMGGLAKFIENLDGEKRPNDILELFEKLILLAYGEKSEDGQRFVKNDHIRSEFASSAAYSALFVALVSDTEEAQKFFNGLVSPTSLAMAQKLKQK